MDASFGPSAAKMSRAHGVGAQFSYTISRIAAMAQA
jgi:hypothetical protein